MHIHFYINTGLLKNCFVNSVFGWNNSAGEIIFSRNLKGFMKKWRVWIEYLKGDLIFDIFMNHFN